MSIYFSQANDDELKNYYKYSLDNEDASRMNSLLRVLFGRRLDELKIKELLNELDEKIKHFQGKNESKSEYRKLCIEMAREYNGIIDKANEIGKFNFELIRDIELNYKEIYKKTGKNGFININKEILNGVVDSYIKLDKELIIIKNKINDLINLII